MRVGNIAIKTLNSSPIYAYLIYELKIKGITSAISMTQSSTNYSIELLTEKRIEELFKEHYAVLTVYANKFLSDLDDAREIVQNVFVQLIDHKDTVKIHTSAKAHLYTSVRNACLNAIKQKNTHAKHHENIKYLNSDIGMGVDKILEQTELEYELYQAIDELPEQCQRIFKMNRFDGFTNQEIADQLGISKRTVETQISKALKTLRNKIGPMLASLLILWLMEKM
ncbi:RNA polymerase sigma-70 factor [Marinifilum breve]|uniref:RNA polymerase sigma-70 factor n=1 Tax=Marinifilum breve TaxID=2184082 RepID=A0A2V4A1Y1_9BACT|nr:RNA polymerase sigma-70 factor [Marinifilum breve]PXY02686.1 RNA polymerase sigma-70 factor [Marinifilum breve]